MIVKTVDSESGHWYAQDGSPAYRIVGKNGVERNTTLKDAKSLNLVPSVTTILKVADKPALTVWMQQNVLLAALTLPRFDGEAESDWLERVMSDSKAAGREAADRGTRMHGELEDFYSKKQRQYPSYVTAVYLAIKAKFGDQPWTCEQSFAHQGFGGKVDLSCPDIVIDFKSKEGPLEKVTTYHEHEMQLAAYRVGLARPKARCANVFFNADGEVKIIEHTEEKLASAWECFLCLLNFYKIKNNL